MHTPTVLGNNAKNRAQAHQCDILENTQQQRAGAAMRAGDLAAPFATITAHAPALDAARLLAGQDLPGLIVVDADQLPVTVLAGSDVLRMAVPMYCQDDPTLAHVVEEASADMLLHNLHGKTVTQCLPQEKRELPVVRSDATALQIAALMARTRIPLVAVVDNEVMRGAVTLDALLDRMLDL